MVERRAGGPAHAPPASRVRDPGQGFLARNDFEADLGHDRRIYLPRRGDGVPRRVPPCPHQGRLLADGVLRHGRDGAGADARRAGGGTDRARLYPDRQLRRDAAKPRGSGTLDAGIDHHEYARRVGKRSGIPDPAAQRGKICGGHGAACPRPSHPVEIRHPRPCPFAARLEQAAHHAVLRRGGGRSADGP